MPFRPQQLEPEDVAASLKSDKWGSAWLPQRPSALFRIMGTTSGSLASRLLPLGGLVLSVQTEVEEE